MGTALNPASALARALAADRPRFNALFAAARGRAAAVDAGDFAALLAETLAPIVTAVDAAAPDRTAAAAAALYETALDLLARRFLGPETRVPEIGAAWRRLLPALPRLVAENPAAAAGVVTNAVHALAVAPGARPEQWIARMVAVGPACPDLAAFRDAGAVVAWQCGLAQLRAAALAAVGRLDAALAGPALGVAPPGPGALKAALVRLGKDPWLEPGAALLPPARPPELRIVARVGAFRGFGGPFLTPPTVRSSGGALYASDGQGLWRLHADRFGSVFAPIAPPTALPPEGPVTLRVDRNGKVAFSGVEGLFPELADRTSFAAAGATAAVTVPLSHAVTLLALA